jgi:hypothetical protein
MSVYRQDQRDQREDLIPMAIATMVAAAGIVALVWLDFGPGSDSHRDDGITTASAVSRAGAFVTPSEPPTHLQKPQTVGLAASAPRRGSGPTSIALPASGE